MFVLCLISALVETKLTYLVRNWTGSKVGYGGWEDLQGLIALLNIIL
jgi:hypothetical protein